MTNHQLVNQDSGNAEWFTPPHIIEAAREVMGSIDLDPASCEAANRIVKAKLYFTEQALESAWRAVSELRIVWPGNVWLNHPFSKRANGLWIDKLTSEFHKGHFAQACCICYAATSEVWFRPLLAYPQCFLHGRTNYLDPITLKPVKGVTKGSVVTYLGPNVSRFAEVFSKLGTVKVTYEWNHH